MDTTARRTPALTGRERALGLRRTVVPTSLGRIIVRTGRRSDGEAPEGASTDATRTAPPRATATILLHGAAGSWTTWTPLVAASDRTSMPFRDLIIPDLPGWGESGELPATASVRDVSGAIIEIARALGYTSWRVIGHSLGGFVALDLAAAAPAATLSVALVSPSGAGVIYAVRRPIRGGLRLPPFAGMLLTMRLLAGLGRSGRALVRTLHRIGALRGLSAPLFAHPSSVHATVIDALADEIRPAAFARAAGLAGTYDPSTWRRITCPVGAVRGAVDVFAGTTDAVAFAAVIPGFHEVILEDAGHFAHIERPAAVLAVACALAGLRRTVPVAAEPHGAPARTSGTLLHT